MSSSSSSGKKLKSCLEYRTDHLSSLPDHLLVDILSLLPLKKAVRTSVLSKRWRYLWKHIHTIDLKADMNYEDFIGVNFWGNTAKVYKKFVSDLLVTKVKMLRINFRFADHYQQEIDHLVGFGIERGVEELYLELPLGNGNPKPYKVPQSTLLVETLTTLKLDSCELQLPASIHLPCLNKLRFRHCRFENITLQTLISNCPALENLCIFHCDFSGHLVFDGVNTVMKTLKISSSYRDFPNQKVEIAIPSLGCLEIGGTPSVGMYSTKNMVSIHTVCLSFNVDEDFDVSGDILKDLRHVNNLKLHLWGSKLNFVHEPETSLLWQQMKTTHLKLVTSFEIPEDLQSICQLLPYFPHLENLEIVVNYADDILFDHKVKCWEHLQYSFSSLLPQLRTVIIYVCIVTEYFHAWHYDGPQPMRTLETVSRYSSNQLKLLRILLSNSKTLEKLVIVVQESRENDRFVELQHKLLGFDKASPAAEIVIIKKTYEQFMQGKWH